MKPSKGKLLIAEPSILTDKEFNRSVIFLTEYNAEGCIGFILNKPTEFKLSDLIPEINCDFIVYNGGPVEQENLYFIHQQPDLIPDSIQIEENIYWGGDFDILTQLLNEGKLSPSEIRFFLGYTGWSAGQLSDEIKEGTWSVVKNTYPKLFLVNSIDIWKNQLMDLGGEYQIWANAPKNPALN